MSLLNGLLKVILFVENMDTQVRFYRNSLDLTIRFPQNVTDFTREYWVEFETGQTTLVLHGGGQKRIGEDVPKLAFSVDNIQSARQELQQRGVRLGEIRSPVPGTYVCDGIDPEGNAFSLDAHD